MSIPLALLTRNGLVVAAIISITGLLDVIDGAVARVSRRSSLRGALLDSFIDRLCEAILTIAMLILGLNPQIIVVFFTFSFLASYLRAKGESLGVSLSGVGLMERPERLIGLITVALTVDLAGITAANTLLLVLAVLTGITVLQRFLYIWRRLSSVK